MKSSANAGRAGRRPGRQGGFSLMELIIASVLAVIVSAMMFTVLTSQEKMSKQTESYAQLQDRLRSALQVVSHHVRMAGYGIGAKVSGTDKSSLVYSTGTLNLPSFSGLPTLFGCDGCGNYDYDPAAKADLVTGGNNGTDQIGLVYRNPGLEFQLDWIQYETLDSTNPLMSCGLTQLLVASIAPDPDPTKDSRKLLNGGDIVCMDETAITNTTSSIAWTLKNPVNIDATPSLSIPVLAGSSAEFNAACNKSIPRRMTCGSIEGGTIGLYVYHETLYMDDNGDSFDVSNRKLAPNLVTNADGENVPLDDIPLATGIEDMQIAYCIPSPAATATVTDMSTALADCVTNPDTSNFWQGSGSKALSSADDIIYALAVRITLVVKGRIDPSGRAFVSARPTIENHDPPEVADSATRPGSTRYPRAVQSTVIQLPNRRYLQGLVKEFYK